MNIETHFARLQAALECWNADNLDGYLELYAPHAVLRGYAGVEPGSAGIRAFYAAFWAAFPSSRVFVDDVFGQGDRIACRFVVNGRHDGPFQGLPPSGRTFELPGITILRFAQGQCVERWSQADFLGLLQQIGPLPTQ